TFHTGRPSGISSMIRIPATISIVILVPFIMTTQRQKGVSQSEPKMVLTLTQKHASAFAALALKGIQKEFPNKPGHVWNNATDAKPPRELHPAFYGCFDWHSSVHGHWMLVRILRLFPDLPESKRIRAVLAEHLTAKNLKAEADYFGRPHAKSFERT